TILRYSQQAIFGEQTRVWSSALSPVFSGGLVAFGYQLVRRRRSIVVWLVFAVCGAAVVSSQGRVFTLFFTLSVTGLTVYEGIRTRKFTTLLRFALIAAVIVTTALAILAAFGRLNPLLNSWVLRFAELDSDLNRNQGSLSSRLEML